MLVCLYLSVFVVGERLVELPSESRDILLVAVRDVARRSNGELVLGDGQALRASHLRALHRLQNKRLL